MDLPYFLVALPQLNDPLFSRSVILVLAHDTNGSMGFVVNKPLVDDENSLAQMIAEVKDLQGETLAEFQEDVFEGGPVNEDNLFALHCVSEVGSADTEIADDLFLSSDPDVFQRLLEREDYAGKRRFFLGSSGWDSGQLESELRTGSWVMIPYDRKFIFETVSQGDEGESWTEIIWKRVLKSGGVDPLTVMGQGSSDSGYN
jgi:putative transcriptional regulator